ncbi:carbonic anhydrase-like protein [Reticulomyxa filosa]|uniref:Carbonic anhydrase-like protein n=1 Tax=Reticulomyxa filosa TaxID=46433 RepID=X6P7Z4_RETFI|nr:carbonic anhydrase-like protein [Reticulomyxa filosa]|eukprot:ETO34650.1 carbonic anhydrase-like protein [Reticulomyxa filosa]
MLFFFYVALFFLYTYSEVNIDYQVNRLVNDWQIRQRVKSGELVIVGLMFDMHNIYGYGHGRILVVNINGDHDELSMKQNSLLKEFRYEGGMPVKRLFSYPSQGANGYVESSMYPQEEMRIVILGLNCVMCIALACRVLLCVCVLHCSFALFTIACIASIIWFYAVDVNF